MAVLNLRTVAAVALGAGVGAALARRLRPEPAERCCERPARGGRCC